MPVINPVLAFNASPVGNPFELREVGLLLAVIWCVNATPTFAFADTELVITGACPLICPSDFPTDIAKTPNTPRKIGRNLAEI